MARPKGSKNRRPILSVAEVERQAVAKLNEKEALDKEMQDILASMDEQKKLLKAKKKEVRKIDKALVVLEEKKAEAIAAAEAAKKKSEIEKTVEAMMSSGHSADEILAALDLLK